MNRRGAQRKICAWMGLWICVLCASCALVLSSCGSCAKLQREFHAHMRSQLEYLALDQRVENVGPAHARLRVGASAFSIVSAAALKDISPYKRTESLRVPADIWGHAGSIQMETSIRFDRIDAAHRSWNWKAQDVALKTGIMVRARFEVPGKRARWTWHAEATVRTRLSVDPGDGNTVQMRLDGARLERVDAKLPWESDAMPAQIDDIVSNGIADAVDAVLLEHQDGAFSVMEIQALNLSRVSLPVRLKSVEIQGETGVVSLALYTALRPTWSGRRRADETSNSNTPSDGVSLVVPIETLNAALRQQSLRRSTPTSIRFSSDEGAPAWVALWHDGRVRDGGWIGRWSLWCLEGHPCQHKSLQTVVRIWAQDGVMVAARDAVPSELRGRGAGSEDEGPASLAELQRTTLVDISMGMVGWLTDDGPSNTLKAVLDTAQLENGALRATFHFR